MKKEAQIQNFFFLAQASVHFARTHHWDEFLPLLFDTNDDYTSEYDDDSVSKWIKMETKKGNVIKTRD